MNWTDLFDKITGTGTAEAAGYPSFRKQLNQKQQASADFIVPPMNQAIKQAENNPRNFGVLSEQGDPNTILNNSIFNNFVRWIQSGQTMPFVDFMGSFGGPVGKGWAPIGAPNDPDNLNQNWIPNVKGALEQNLGPEEYKRWHQYNMVQTPMDNFRA